MQNGSEQANTSKPQTAFSSRPFRCSAWNKIELSFGDFHSMCVATDSPVDRCSRNVKSSKFGDAKMTVGLCRSLSACMVNHQPFAVPSQTLSLSIRNTNGENSQCITPCLFASRTRRSNLYSQHED